MRRYLVLGLLLLTAGCSTYDEPRYYGGTGAVSLYQQCVNDFKPPVGAGPDDVRRYRLEWQSMCMNHARMLQADNQAALNQMGMALILQNQYQQQLRGQQYRGF